MNLVPPLTEQQAADYFARIGFTPEPEAIANADLLRIVHFAHATTIPFENLSIFLGEPIRLDRDSLVDKLVTRSRGGYCFEQNLLLASALTYLGYSVALLEARVLLPGDHVSPRHHMALKVEMGSTSMLCDVGFGRYGLIEPISMIPGRVAEQGDWKFRLTMSDSIWTLCNEQKDEWQPQYTFTLAPCYPVDYEAPNWFVSTHPSSIFTRTITVQRLTPTVRHLFVNDVYTMLYHDSEVSRPIDESERLDLLRDVFGLALPGRALVPPKLLPY